MSDFFSNKARAAAVAAAVANGSSSKTKPKEAGRVQPWVEKYRPKTLDDVAAQEHTVAVLQRTLQASNLPHMLFYGPPGTGKTSTILALAKQLFGPALFGSRVLELNASDERGISVVREKVKDFARQQLSHAPASPEYRAAHPCPPFKIVVLDEADSMTHDAQAALRRTMETYSRITRFCLVCNYVTRIIDPLASRCSKFRFKPLDSANARARLQHIAAAERVNLPSPAVDALIDCSGGDLRKAITFLQSCARLVGAEADAARASGGGDDGDDAMEIDGGGAEKANEVSAASVREIAGVIPDPVLDRLIKAVQPRKNKASVYPEVASCVEDMVADGWSAGQLVAQLYEKVMFDELVSNPHKNKIALVFSEVDKRLVDGADEHLEMLDLALRIAGILGQA